MSRDTSGTWGMRPASPLWGLVCWVDASTHGPRLKCQTSVPSSSLDEPQCPASGQLPLSLGEQGGGAVGGPGSVLRVNLVLTVRGQCEEGGELSAHTASLLGDPSGRSSGQQSCPLWVEAATPVWQLEMPVPGGLFLQCVYSGTFFPGDRSCWKKRELRCPSHRINRHFFKPDTFWVSATQSVLICDICMTRPGWGCHFSPLTRGMFIRVTQPVGGRTTT